MLGFLRKNREFIANTRYALNEIYCIILIFYTDLYTLLKILLTNLRQIKLTKNSYFEWGKREDYTEKRYSIFYRKFAHSIIFCPKLSHGKIYLVRSKVNDSEQFSSSYLHLFHLVLFFTFFSTKRVTELTFSEALTTIILIYYTDCWP